MVKKISDTNYLVRTGRRKETQVCHINVLKAYHEKPKPELVTINNRLDLENPTHSESCVGLEAEKQEDSESEVTLGNDQQPIKLQNSQILNDLGTKLSHLPSVQRKELAEVITQYREVLLSTGTYFQMSQIRQISTFVTPSSLYQYKLSNIPKNG